MPHQKQIDIYTYFGAFMTTLLVIMIIVASLFLLVCLVVLTMGIILNIKARRRRAREERDEEEGRIQLPSYSDERPRGYMNDPRLLLQLRSDGGRIGEEEVLGRYVSGEGLVVPYSDEPPEYVEVIAGSTVEEIQREERSNGESSEGSSDGERIEGIVEIGVGK